MKATSSYLEIWQIKRNNICYYQFSVPVPAMFVSLKRKCMWVHRHMVYTHTHTHAFAHTITHTGTSCRKKKLTHTYTTPLDSMWMTTLSYSVVILLACTHTHRHIQKKNTRIYRTHIKTICVCSAPMEWRKANKTTAKCNVPSSALPHIRAPALPLPLVLLCPTPICFCSKHTHTHKPHYATEDGDVYSY